MNDDNAPLKRESFGTQLISGFFAFARVLARFIFILLLVGVFVLLLFGIPYVYYRFVTPAVSELQHVASAQSEQEELNQRFLNELHSMQQRADSLETRLDSEKQRFGEMMQSISDLASTQQFQTELYLETQNAEDETLKAIRNEISAIDLKLVDLSNAIQNFESSLGSVEEKSSELEARLFAEDEPINQLRRDIQILKAMELLTRSRLFLSQNNLGLAEDEIRSAQELIARMVVPEPQQEALADTLERISQALENLPQSPELAAQDLEVAWKLLNVELFSNSLDTGVLKATPTPMAAEATETPLASAAVSPTATR